MKFVLNQIIVDIVILGSLVLFFIFLLFASQLSFNSGTYQINGGKEQHLSMPLNAKGEKKSIVDFIVPLKLSLLPPQSLFIVPDNCLRQLIVNDKEIQLEADICWPKGGIVAVGDSLHAGENILKVKVWDESGRVRLNILNTPDRRTAIAGLKLTAIFLVLLYGMIRFGMK